MTYKEKKALYESIMQRVAKVVKQRINEDLLPSFAHEEDELISEISEPEVEFQQLEDITFDDFYNRNLNTTFYNLNDDLFLLDKGNIGWLVDISMNGSTQEIQLWGSSFGELIEKFHILFSASYENKQFTIISDGLQRRFYKYWNFILRDEYEYLLDDVIDRVKKIKFKTIRQIADFINNKYVKFKDEVEAEIKAEDERIANEDYNNGLLC